MNKYVITISRQFAVLGRTIAQKMSEELEIEFYNRDICIDSGRFGAENTAIILCDIARSVFG